MITLKQAKALRPGDILHHKTKKDKDGSCQMWRVINKPLTWKDKPTKVYVGLEKYGGDTQYEYLTEIWLHLYHFPKKCKNTK